MKGSAVAIISIFIFVAFLIYFTSEFALLSGSVGVLNVTNTNETIFLATGNANYNSFGGDICTLSGSENPLIDLLQSFVNAIPLINCVTGFTSFLFSYQSIQTGIVWLGFLIFGLVGALIYIGLKLARGGG